jgi:hypothetical protein
LKEWAVTVSALAGGGQILLMRKGGIHEEGKNFRVTHSEFLLYPTYEHQREELLKVAYKPGLRQLLSESSQSGNITFSHWARSEEVLEVSQQELIDELSPYHIWTNAYAQARLHWKPKWPLSIMLLRVYRMVEPVSVPIFSDYEGCKSWVKIVPQISLGQLQPVLSDEDFHIRANEIKGSMGLSVETVNYGRPVGHKADVRQNQGSLVITDN